MQGMQFLISTLYFLLGKMYNFFEKSNNRKFDQVCKNNYHHLEYEININKFLTMYIFIWNIFGMVDAVNFPKKLNQS
jgi:hypothetical protein